MLQGLQNHPCPSSGSTIESALSCFPNNLDVSKNETRVRYRVRGISEKPGGMSEHQASCFLCALWDKSTVF